MIEHGQGSQEDYVQKQDIDQTQLELEFMDFVNLRYKWDPENIKTVDPSHHLVIRERVLREGKVITTRNYYGHHPINNEYLPTESFGRSIDTFSNILGNNRRINEVEYYFEKYGELDNLFYSSASEEEFEAYHKELLANPNPMKKDTISLIFHALGANSSMVISRKQGRRLTVRRGNGELSWIKLSATFKNDAELILSEDILKAVSLNSIIDLEDLKRMLPNADWFETVRSLQLSTANNALYTHIDYGYQTESFHTPLFIPEEDILSELADEDLLLDPINPDHRIDISWKITNIRKAAGINWQIKDTDEERRMKEIMERIRLGLPSPNHSESL